MENRTPDPQTCIAEEGFALLAVLGFLLILSAVLIPFASSARIRALTSANQYDDTRYELALNAINAVIARRLAKDRPPSDGPSGNSNASCPFGGGLLEIRIQKHSGLIDLNVASTELLQLGLAATGVDASIVPELAQTIAQYRRLDGDRNAVVPSQMVTVDGLKFASFEDVAELYDFIPLRSVPLGQLMQVFTVSSRSAVVTNADLSQAIQSKLSAYPEAAKAIVATATQGADFATIESVFQDGSVSHYQAGIYQIAAGETGAVRLVNSLASDMALLPGIAAARNGCSQLLDSKMTALLREVFS